MINYIMVMLNINWKKQGKRDREKERERDGKGNSRQKGLYWNIELFCCQINLLSDICLNYH